MGHPSEIKSNNLTNQLFLTYPKTVPSTINSIFTFTVEKMPAFSLRNKTVLWIAILLSHAGKGNSQANLLLNGGFEDVNTCTEYNAECGVEAWFYLKDVKAEMLSNETNTNLLGSNSFGIFYNWLGYTGFSPLIGTRLPCGLQKDQRYIFTGIISAKLNPKLKLKAGICLGEKFYVPRRPFSKNMQPDSIVAIHPIPNTNFFRFEYSFIADGKERYLTFGTYVEEDTVGAKKKLIGVQTVSVVLDDFQLVSGDKREIACPDFILNKQDIYNYNFRHKEMDYSLYGRGELAIVFTHEDSNSITRIEEPPPPPPPALKPDTLKLGDVFFDFNKAKLKPEAIKMLQAFFITNKTSAPIDSMYVEGHTDSIGTDSRNLTLSLERCESIRQWLLQNNIVAPAAIQVHPFGRTKPVATNSTTQGRAMNRRVEMIVFRRPGK
ncbi:MAG: OmpA family protein [Bacteroidota bacterium]